MKRIVFLIVTMCCITAASAQNDSVANRSILSRLHVGGYGEVAYSRNYYSDHVSRYSQPEERMIPVTDVSTSLMLSSI